MESLNQWSTTLSKLVSATDIVYIVYSIEYIYIHIYIYIYIYLVYIISIIKCLYTTRSKLQWQTWYNKIRRVKYVVKGQWTSYNIK